MTHSGTKSRSDGYKQDDEDKSDTAAAYLRSSLATAACPTFFTRRTRLKLN
jgi:hypothetical protein